MLPDQPRATTSLILVLTGVLLLVALFFDGAFAVVDWAPLAVLLLVAVVVLGPGGRPRLRTHGFALALWAFAGWSIASLAWSPAPGAGVETALRNVFYAAVALAVVATVPDRLSAGRLSRWLVVGLGALVAATLLGLVVGGKDLLLAGRLDQPVGYRNGTAAVMGMAAVALLCTAAPRNANPVFRGLSFSGAVVALGLAFLTQSRGIALGLACGVAAMLALGPDRLRRVWLTVAAVGLVAVAGGPLLEPYDAFLSQRRVDPADLQAAVAALAVLGVAAFVAMTGVALLDGGLRLTQAAKQWISAGAATVLAAGAAAGAVAAVATVGDPIDFAGDKLDEFRTLTPAAVGETRLGSTGGQRYDLYGIAWNAFKADPLTGAGEGGYARRYYLERATDRNLSEAHSLPLGVLATTGLIGALLLAGAFAAAAGGILSRWRALDAPARRAASAVAAAAVVVFSQAAVDWFWAIAGLTALGVAGLALALRVATAPEPPGRDPAPVAPPVAVSWRATAAVSAALVTLLFLSATYVRVARAERADPERSLQAARTAERFNPLWITPDHLQAGALESLGRTAQARAQLLEALRKEPSSFVTLALLGDLEVRAGRLGRARAHYRRALALNPRDVGLQQLARIGA